MLIITSTNPFFLLFPHRKSLAYFWPAQSIIDIVSRPQYQFPHTRKAIKWKFPEQVLKYFSFTGPFGVSVIKRMLQLMGSSRGGVQRWERGATACTNLLTLHTLTRTYTHSLTLTRTHPILPLSKWKYLEARRVEWAINCRIEHIEKQQINNKISLTSVLHTHTVTYANTCSSSN